MTPHDALVLIAHGLPQGLIQWAVDNGVEEHVIRHARGFAPRWRETAEYRGALLHITRRIAERALDDEWRQDLSDQSATGQLDNIVPDIHERE